MDALRPGGALGDVEVALDPAELEGLDEAGVRALYEQRLEEQRAAHSREVRAFSCAWAPWMGAEGDIS